MTKNGSGAHCTIQIAHLSLAQNLDLGMLRLGKCGNILHESNGESMKFADRIPHSMGNASSPVIRSLLQREGKGSSLLNPTLTRAGSTEVARRIWQLNEGRRGKVKAKKVGEDKESVMRSRCDDISASSSASVLPHLSLVSIYGATLDRWFAVRFGLSS